MGVENSTLKRPSLLSRVKQDFEITTFKANKLQERFGKNELMVKEKKTLTLSKIMGMGCKSDAYDPMEKAMIS